MRRRTGRLLLIVMLMGLTGCAGRPAASFRGEFQTVSLQDAPDEVQVLWERMGAAPGLFAVHEQTETYLLVCAGRVEGGGQRLEVLDMTPPAGPRREARVLAALRSAPQEGEYPCAAVHLEGDATSVAFKARLSNLKGEVLELQQVQVVDH